MSVIFEKRIKKEIKKYSDQNFKFDNVYLRPNYENLNEWFFIIHGLDTPYSNGYYMGKILLPSQYPFKPADFEFITPNGRFELNKKICTSFSGFHPESHSAVWNISSMMQGIVSFMNDVEDKGIGCIQIRNIEEGIENKKKLANLSKEWNLNNEIFKSVFADFIKENDIVI